jgi:hypothetical protein
MLYSAPCCTVRCVVQYAISYIATCAYCTVHHVASCAVSHSAPCRTVRCVIWSPCCTVRRVVQCALWYSAPCGTVRRVVQCAVPFDNVPFCNLPLYNVPLGNVPLCNVPLRISTVVSATECCDISTRIGQKTWVDTSHKSWTCCLSTPGSPSRQSSDKFGDCKWVGHNDIVDKVYSGRKIH